jgi:hypothetical protein
LHYCLYKSLFIACEADLAAVRRQLTAKSYFKTDFTHFEKRGSWVAYVEMYKREQRERIG